MRPLKLQSFARDTVRPWAVVLLAGACMLACSGKDRVAADLSSGGMDAGGAAHDAGAMPASDGGKPVDHAGDGGAATGPHADAAAAEGGAGEGGSQTVDAAAQDAGDPPQAEDPSCDLNGIWAARLTTFSRDDVFQAVQTASNWYYYEIEQRGREVTITAALDCGIQVSGSADVTINRATTAALMKRNDQTGRHGQFYRDGDHCTLSIDRFYSTRGVPRSVYLPSDTSANPDLASITPALPTAQSPDGNEDWDGDGHPGIAFNVAGLGTRHVVERDWNEFFSDDSYSIAPDSDAFVARAQFDNQEEILETSGSLGGLLMAGSTPATGLNHRISWQRLGRTADEAAVKAVRDPDDLTTCYNVQAALPHDTASM